MVSLNTLSVLSINSPLSLKTVKKSSSISSNITGVGNFSKAKGPFH